MVLKYFELKVLIQTFLMLYIFLIKMVSKICFKYFYILATQQSDLTNDRHYNWLLESHKKTNFR